MQCLSVEEDIALGTMEDIEARVDSMHAQRRDIKKAEAAAVANPSSAALATLVAHDAQSVITARVKHRETVINVDRRRVMVEAAVAGKTPLSRKCKKYDGDDDDISTRLPTEGPQSHATSDDDEFDDQSAVGGRFMEQVLIYDFAGFCRDFSIKMQRDTSETNDL